MLVILPLQAWTYSRIDDVRHGSVLLLRGGSTLASLKLLQLSTDSYVCR